MIFTTDGKYQTRSGRPAKYVMTYREGTLDLFIVGGKLGETILSIPSNQNGKPYNGVGGEHPQDIIHVPVTRSVFRNVFGSSFHLGGDRESVNECNLRAKRRDAGFGSITDDVSVGVLEYKYEDDKLIGLVLHTDVG